MIKQANQSSPLTTRQNALTGDIVRRIPCEGEEVRQRRRLHLELRLYFLRTKNSVARAATGKRPKETIFMTLIARQSIEDQIDP